MDKFLIFRLKCYNTKINLMKIQTYIFLLFSLCFSAISAQDNYSEFLDNAMKAVHNNDERGFTTNIKYFTTALEKDKVTPGALSSEHHELYTKCLFEALKNELTVSEDIANTAVKFLNYDIENNPYNMYALGRLYDFGHGVPKDKIKAKYWYEQSALKGNSYGMNALGALYLEGEAVGKDTERAKYWYEKAAMSGNTISMTNLANGYLNGTFEGGFQDGVVWLMQAAEAGVPNAFMTLGSLYLTGQKISADPEKSYYWYNRAFQFHEKEAANGNIKSINSLAFLYENGFGVKEDDQKAIDLYKVAAKKGSDAAERSLAGYYYRNKNYSEAKFWLENLAKNGDNYGMFMLGDMYEKGTGGEQNYNKAIQWYQKSANNSYLSSMFALGVLYENGRGVSEDAEQAIYWYEKAAEKNHLDAIFNLGAMYSSGRAGNKDMEKAVYWWRKAAKLGDEVAQSNLRKLGETW